jgi:hypothetical protein
MQIGPVINAVEAALLSQATLASSDPAVDAAVTQLVSALGPALQMAAMEIAEQAAAEVRAQLPEHTVDVVLADGDPALRIGESTRRAEPRQFEDLDARITLRLPPTLKQVIEDAAQKSGDSVNSWVVDALGKRANQKSRGEHVDESFDL